MKNGKYSVVMLMNGIEVHGTAYYKDGEWYLTEESEYPLKDGVVREVLNG